MSDKPLVVIESFTIYHSPNAYLGTVLLRRALADRPEIGLLRRPIQIPRARGVMVAEMLGGKESRNAGSYHREDCRRWAAKYAIPFQPVEPAVFRERAARWAGARYEREELPARAYYAAPPEQRDALDEALFAAAWVEGRDVNEPDTIRWAAARVGISPDALLADVQDPAMGDAVRAALADFDRLACPGVPTLVINGERFSARTGSTGR